MPKIRARGDSEQALMKGSENMEQIKLIGVCLSTLHEEDRFSFVSELNRHAVINGCRLLVFNSCADMYEQSPESNKGSSAVFRLIPYEKLSALIIFPNIMYDTCIIDEIAENCRLHDLPLISIDKEIDGSIVFAFKNADIFEKLCRHVIEDHGARKLYMLAGFEGNVYSNERIEAFKRALAVNNIPIDDNNIGYGCFWEQPTVEVLTQWFVTEKREIPDAIICANDFMAIAASSFLQSMGVRIPEDCIITGFDGVKQTEYLPPQITTCKQDFDKMSRLIFETILKLWKGGTVEKHVYVDFNIIYSQSCGCKPVSYENTSNSIRTLLNSLSLADERHKMICNTQTCIPQISDVNYLARIIINKFKFDTCIFALNNDIFEPPDFGSQYKDSECFGRNIDILYHRYNKTEYERCCIPKKMLLPRYDLLLSRELPIIVCCSHFSTMVMGYCVFQTEIDIDEYEKIHSMMSTVSAALGSFHSKVQIENINDKLQRLSQRDFMTGLFNRRGFFERLDGIISDAANTGSALVLISADLDELKYINDTFGHSEGDNAIITVSRALLSSSPQSGLCARFGGDEFCMAIVIRKEDPHVFFTDFKNRFFNFLHEYNANANKTYMVKASIGSSYAIIDGDLNTDEIIKAADEKMYACKLEHKQLDLLGN